MAWRGVHSVHGMEGCAWHGGVLWRVRIERSAPTWFILSAALAAGTPLYAMHTMRTMPCHAMPCHAMPCHAHYAHPCTGGRLVMKAALCGGSVQKLLMV